VLRYDRRGYGRSIDAGPPAGLDDHVEDLLGLVGDGPAVLVGHSYGALIALVAAARGPERIGAVAAFEPPQPWLPWWPTTSPGGVAVQGDPADAAEAFLRRMVGDARWEALPERTRAQRRAEGRALVADLRSVREGGRPLDPAALRLPVLVGRGSGSPDHLRRSAEVMAATIPGAELHEFDGVDHGVHLVAPDRLARWARRAVDLAGAEPGVPAPEPR
jgi:pimeloyl-ACP methyl ester carboxylesterase